jgi:hypothetical protein
LTDDREWLEFDEEEEEEEEEDDFQGDDGVNEEEGEEDDAGIDANNEGSIRSSKDWHADKNFKVNYFIDQC